jgi:hypothetical protein
MFPLEIHLYFPQLQSKEDTLLSYDLFLQQNQKEPTLSKFNEILNAMGFECEISFKKISSL